MPGEKNYPKCCERHEKAARNIEAMQHDPWMRAQLLDVLAAAEMQCIARKLIAKGAVNAGE